MLSFKKYSTESVIGGVMDPYGRNQPPNVTANKSKKARDVQPDRIDISQAARDHMNKMKSGPTGPENSMAGLIGGTRKAK
tara:strand:+ start:396 stop:635 length:240 start_codon:yes stop_codon:yes gene_type:complete